MEKMREKNGDLLEKDQKNVRKIKNKFEILFFFKFIYFFVCGKCVEQI